ncbi:3'-5' exonuclease [Paenibacillus rhizovicinus]|uniref:3'-5' exonuclease n=1 Tax=Paenibacillus rhizovicinus TaxID=2704463 RepID=UPI001CDC1BAF|nr:3'-5' exonuclease [Paenibacillus rhizovicinus]
MADPEQRIYEFRGADPSRISDFIFIYSPQQFDFGSENNRSNGTDIVQFGNDLISGKNVGKQYNQVKVNLYPFRQGLSPHLDLKVEVLKARKRLIANHTNDWSLAILVPSKRLMHEVSLCLDTHHIFANNKSLPRVSHELALETAAPSLAAVLVSNLLDLGSNSRVEHTQLIADLCEHMRGRNGDASAPKQSLDISNALQEFITTGKIRGSKRQMILQDCINLVNACCSLEFTGDPSQDWKNVCSLLDGASSDQLKQVGKDIKYLKMLHRGSELRSRLASLWRLYGNYSGAGESIKAALLQEYFANSSKVWRGVHVMTIHKSKGKEFDEVIVYEGLYQGKIVRNESTKKEIDQARLNLRVAVTRARQNVLIITPINDVCPLLR